MPIINTHPGAKWIETNVGRCLTERKRTDYAEAILGRRLVKYRQLMHKGDKLKISEAQAGERPLPGESIAVAYGDSMLDPVWQIIDSSD